MADALPALLAFVGFLVVFPAWWCLVVWFIARLGGWSALAREFGTDREPPLSGKRATWQSASLSLLGRYNNCLEVVVDAEAVWLRPFWIFRVGHRQLRIPYDRVRVSEQKAWHGESALIELDGRKLTLMGEGARLVLASAR